MFPADFKELLSVLNKRKVKYLLIGGYAVSLHAQPRTTKDLDLFVGPDARNARALYDALAYFGAPVRKLKPSAFMKPGLFFRIGQAPLMVDILPAIQGIEFKEAWKNRVEIEIDSASGLRAFVISSADLIATKLAAGRPQDLADVAALRRVRQSAQGARRKKRRTPLPNL
jgi:predicted nucleotidyltransferase